jgi:hypothetical protein
MKRRNAFVIALLIGVVALVGLVAATRSARLGHAAGRPTVSSASIDARMRALDRADASLRRALAQKPAVGRAAPPHHPPPRWRARDRRLGPRGRWVR